MKRTWSAILLSLALAACESPTSWSEALVIEPSAAQTDADSATVAGATGGIVVHGVYLASGAGYALRAWYDVAGAGVRLYVSGQLPASGGTRPALTGEGYRITIPMPAGTYTVRVVHREHDGTNAREVAATEVTVGPN